MQPLPMITKQQIEDRTSERSLERGARYFADGMVESVVWRSGLLTAEVLGSEQPYDVLVRIGGRGISSAECSCPFDYGGDCKHIVAVLLHYMAHCAEIEQRPSVGNLIADLDRDQLKLLVLHLVERRPAMMDSAERFLKMI